MNNSLDEIAKIEKQFKELHPNLSDYEVCQLAIQWDRNEFLKHCAYEIKEKRKAMGEMMKERGRFMGRF